MAQAELAAELTGKRKKAGFIPVLAGVILSTALGGTGFYAAYSGLLPFGGASSTGHPEADAKMTNEALPDVDFVPIDPLIITLSGSGPIRHLRFRAELEVARGQSSNAITMMPRILDAMNSYLRAVTVEDLERSTALLTLRAQMLRRIQLVVGETRINDLLITEFVLN